MTPDSPQVYMGKHKPTTPTTFGAKPTTAAHAARTGKMQQAEAKRFQLVARSRFLLGGHVVDHGDIIDVDPSDPADAGIVIAKAARLDLDELRALLTGSAIPVDAEHAARAQSCLSPASSRAGVLDIVPRLALATRRDRD
ncbi:MAG: hypothetical protein WD771_08820 [Gemmatimonadaceae bacterium]